MNERRTPLIAMLDLLVYTPVGLAVTVSEELPKLAAKGRARVGPQVSTARLVGQFAVSEGRRRATRLVEQPMPAGDPASEPVAPLYPLPDPPPAPTRPPTPRRPPGVPRRPQAKAATLSPEHLAIPEYDSLSASQVVQRLAGLSSAELVAVGEYEAATRGRRTILARVSQLQGS